MNVIHVHIGKVHIAQGEVQLKALLGSCVGVAFIWKERGICGLAHCLLPNSEGKTTEIGARYVDQAVRSLLTLMEITPTDRKYLEVVVAGGSNMTSQVNKSEKNLVGSANSEAVMAVLKDLRIPVNYTDFGGLEGRTITVDCSAMSASVELIPRICDEA